MRKWLIMFAVLLQVGVLAYMVYGRESIVSSGVRIEIPTAPIDPRDPFRGDFVRLKYEMNQMPMHSAQFEMSEAELKKDTPVYTVLRQEPGGSYHPDYMTDKKPSDGMFIKGRVNGRIIQRWDNFRFLNIRYGIEQWFVEQGTGIAIENRQGVRGGPQVPMFMEVALGDNGTAVLTGFRWGDIGTQLSLADMILVEPTGNTPQNENQQSDNETSANTENPEQTNEPSLWLTFENISSATVVMDNSPDLCNLTLIVARPERPKFKPLFTGCTDSSTRSVVAIAPGESHKVAIDLSDPRWHIVRIEDGETDDLRRLEPNRFFRFKYQHEDSDASSGKDDLWVGTLRTQSFSGRGNVD